MADHVAFIGIGAMGCGMASNIRQKMSPDSTLFINDMNAEACEGFRSEYGSHGPVEIVETAREAVEKAKTIISMVPGADDVRNVYLDGPDCIMAAAFSVNLGDRLIVESSTIDPQTTRDVGEALEKAGVGTYVDAPVSGGIARAADGGLAFMIGHADDGSTTAKRIHDFISMMGNRDKIFFCGPLGAGLAAKISNNYMSGSINVALSEALSVGIRSGVDQQVLFNVIKASSGQTWMMENHNPVPGLVASAPSSRGYERSFPHRLMMKDLGLGVQAAKEVGIQPSMAETALKMYTRAAEDDEVGALDYTSVYKLINR